MLANCRLPIIRCFLPDSLRCRFPTKSILRSEERSPQTLQWWDDDENGAPQRRKEERIAFVEQSGRWGEETHKTDVLCDVDDMQDVEVLAWLALDPHCFGLRSPNFRLLW